MRIGLDIGGTKVAAVLLGETGDVHARSWQEHAARGNDEVARALADAVCALPVDGTSSPIGVSVSGLVGRDGTVTAGEGLALRGDLAAAIGALLPHPVRVFNDAEATLRAVRHARLVSRGEDERDVVLLTIGTGIGGAVVTEGRALRGRAGLAGELGHLPVLPATDERCVCGSSGCFEQYAGGKGIALLARRAIEDGTASAALRAHAEKAGAVSTKDVVRLAREGDATSAALLDQAAACCATAIRALCVTTEPEVVILGGSVAHGAADILPRRIEDHLRRQWPFAALVHPPTVELDEVGPYAAAIGAAMLAAEPAPESAPAPESTSQHHV